MIRRRGMRRAGLCRPAPAAAWLQTQHALRMFAPALTHAASTPRSMCALCSPHSAHAEARLQARGVCVQDALDAACQERGRLGPLSAPARRLVVCSSSRQNLHVGTGCSVPSSPLPYALPGHVTRPAPVFARSEAQRAPGARGRSNAGAGGRRHRRRPCTPRWAALLTFAYAGAGAV